MRRFGLALVVGILLTATPAAPASETQSYWVANANSQTGSQLNNLVRGSLQGAGVTYSPAFTSPPISLTGWRDSLYVGASDTLVRTDFDGNILESKTGCGSFTALAYHDHALYVGCTHVSTDPTIERIALHADGSFGAMTQWAVRTNWIEDLAIANGYM
ncbi:MAG: hypothetical protein ACR2J9_05770, partial [Gaiellales bacterium]